MARIEFIITAGGTREPLDAVRYIGNVSTGRLGACIADEARSRGHAIRYLHGAGCCLPRCGGEIPIEGYVTSADLKRILEKHVRAVRPPAVVVHAAAVSDYTPVPAKGKIPSDREELILRLKRTEKVVDLIKIWNPDVLLVKFKLESNRTPDELLKAGIEAGRRSRADWVVANDTRALGRESHHALIIRSDDSYIEARGKQEIARRLLDELEACPRAR